VGAKSRSSAAQWTSFRELGDQPQTHERQKAIASSLPTTYKTIKRHSFDGFVGSEALSSDAARTLMSRREKGSSTLLVTGRRNETRQRWNRFAVPPA